jgi:hypothetical protein
VVAMNGNIDIQPTLDLFGKSPLVVSPQAVFFR